MLTNNSLRAFFLQCFIAICKAAKIYINPIITVATIPIKVIETIAGGNSDKLKTNVRIQNPIKVIEAIGGGNSDRLKTNVKMQNPTNKIFDWNRSLGSAINILNPAFL